MALPLHRRDAIRAGVALVAAPLFFDSPPPPTRGVRAFRLTETAGLGRSGYPVATTVPDAGGGRNFRLVHDGRTVPAQFRQGVDRDGQPEVALDFLADLRPMEVQRFEASFGPEVEPGPEPAGGLTVERRDGMYHVAQGTAIRYAISTDRLDGIQEAGSPRLGYLKPGVSKIKVFSHQGDGLAGVADLTKLVDFRSRITRQGPMAIGLRFESGGFEGGSGLTLDLTFFHSKTGMQGVLRVDDPAGRISGLGLDLGLLVEGTPTLVDFGASTTIHGRIEGVEEIDLIAGEALGETRPRAGQRWTVRRSGGDSTTILAASTPDDPRPPEGWVQVTNAKRRVALALAGFGQSRARDWIAVKADGGLRLRRDFAQMKEIAPPGPKTLAFWLHFAPMPVPVGASTSPRSMMTPPKVEWDRPQPRSS